MGLVIGFYSTVPRSGKNTAADVVAKYLQAPVQEFSHPGKDMLTGMVMRLGYTEEEAKNFFYTQPETVIPELGVTGRYLQQTLMTDWGRNQVHKDLWVMLTIPSSKPKGLNTVISGVRFPNEYEYIKAQGGKVYKITNSKALEAFKRAHGGGLENHPSEGLLEEHEFDGVLSNESTKEAFEELVFRNVVLPNFPQNHS